MGAEGHRFEAEDIEVGLDLGGEQRSVVVLGGDGRRLMSFELPRSLRGFEDLVRRCGPIRLGRP